MTDQEPRGDELLPARDGESDEERRLREAINRAAGQVLTALDAAVRLRTASPRASKARHRARGHLEDFGLVAMHALALSRG